MDPAILKIIAILIIFTTGMIGGLYPLRTKTSQSGLRKLSLGNAFSAGIFIGAGLLHMLADSNDAFSSMYNDFDFPLGMLCCGIGFLFILFLDKGILGGSEDVVEITQGKKVTAYILLLVLSIHSIIAGATLGLESNFLSSIAIFLAIIAHKGAAAFALGLNLQKANFTKSRHIKTTALFSSTTPFGVLLGLVLAAVLASKDSQLIEAIFDGLAAGTFLYIAIVDILDDVFEQKEDRWYKIPLVVAGFTLMAIIAIYT